MAAGPALPLYLSEPGRAVADYGLYLAALPFAPRLPRGDEHPVLVMPGLLAGDGTTSALRAVLRRAGYGVHGWRLGRNIGPTALAFRGMRDRVDELHERYGRPVSLIGWSLGGIYARALARRNPDAVRQVITLGSPFRLSSPDQSRAARAYDRYSHLHVEHWQLPFAREAEPLPVPTSSIYSHYDGIVAWRACLNEPGERAENIAVMASHLGIGHHPAAIWAIADRLAQPEGTWAPFRAPLFLRPAFPRPASPVPDEQAGTSAA